MKIKTLAFGEIEIDDDKIVDFVNPMLGFDQADRFALLDINPNSPFKLLQLADNPEVCFLVADPFVFFPDYKIDLAADQVKDLELNDEDSATLLTIIAIKENGKLFTANLYAPIVVNPKNFLGKQILLSGTSFKVDEPLPL